MAAAETETKRVQSVLDDGDNEAQSDPYLSDLRRELKDNGYQAGIAYIGFVGNETTESEMRTYLESSQYGERYTFFNHGPIADAGGADLYAIATAGKDCSASVYSADINEDGTYDVHMDQVLYEGKGGDYLLVRCNPSELYSNAAILFQTEDEQFWVHPMLSGMNGRVMSQGCYDFSMYPDDSGIQDDVMMAYSVLIDADEIQYYVGLGMSLQYTGEIQEIDGRPCWIFALGSEHDGQFVREFYYGVSDNLIYAYDVMTDTWNVLGAG